MDTATENDQQLPENKKLLESYCQMLTTYFIFTFFTVIGIAILLLTIHYVSQNGNVTAASSFWERLTNKRIPLLLFVFFGGALGAFFSAISRLFAFEDLPKALSLDVKWKNRYIIMYSLIPPITGSISAVIFYLMMASGLISGDLFVKFGCIKEGGDCNSFLGLLSYAPQTPQDVAKALVWSFISGFSERLVPDAIEKLGKKHNLG